MFKLAAQCLFVRIQLLMLFHQHVSNDPDYSILNHSMYFHCVSLLLCFPAQIRQQFCRNIFTSEGDKLLLSSSATWFSFLFIWWFIYLLVLNDILPSTCSDLKLDEWETGKAEVTQMVLWLRLHTSTGTRAKVNEAQLAHDVYHLVPLMT